MKRVILLSLIVLTVLGCQSLPMYTSDSDAGLFIIPIQNEIESNGQIFGRYIVLISDYNSGEIIKRVKIPLVSTSVAVEGLVSGQYYISGIDFEYNNGLPGGSYTEYSKEYARFSIRRGRLTFSPLVLGYKFYKQSGENWLKPIQRRDSNQQVAKKLYEDIKKTAPEVAASWSISGSFNAGKVVREEDSDGVLAIPLINKLDSTVAPFGEYYLSIADYENDEIVQTVLLPESGDFFMVHGLKAGRYYIAESEFVYKNGGESSGSHSYEKDFARFRITKGQLSISRVYFGYETYTKDGEEWQRRIASKSRDHENENRIHDVIIKDFPEIAKKWGLDSGLLGDLPYTMRTLFREPEAQFESKIIDIQIMQDGKIIPIENDFVTLKRKPFKFVFTHKGDLFTLIHLWNKPDAYDLTQNPTFFANYKLKEGHGGAGYYFNEKRGMNFTYTGFNAWFYYSDDENRFDLNEVDNDVYSSYRTIENFNQFGRDRFDFTTNGTVAIEDSDIENFYFVCVETDWEKAQKSVDSIQHILSLKRIHITFE